MLERLLTSCRLYVLLFGSGLLSFLFDDEIRRLFPRPGVPSSEETVLRTTCLYPSEPLPRRSKVVLLAMALSDLLPKSLFLTGVGV